MKAQVVILLAFLALAVGSDLYGNGQPGCKTDEEMIVKIYKNNWNPRVYWVCEEQGKPATLEECPNGTGYQNRVYFCIPWQYWRWEKPQIPPSKPDLQ